MMEYKKLIKLVNQCNSHSMDSLSNPSSKTLWRSYIPRLIRLKFFQLVVLLYLSLWLIRTGAHYYQKNAINGTSYLLLGEISIPPRANYSCPYFRLVPGDGEPLQKKCSTCAIVSNSGHLLGSKAGSQIDKSECVLRMNNGSTEPRYQEDVGSKTTIRILSARGLTEYMRFLSGSSPVAVKPQDLLIWDSTLRPPRKDRVSRQAIQVAEAHPVLQVYLLNNFIPGQPSFDSFIDRELGISSAFTGSSCSTGFYSMVVAAYLCDDITVYGMAPPEYCSLQEGQTNKTHFPYHYQPPHDKTNECDFFNSRWKKTIHGHRFMTEHLIFKRWSKHRRIHFAAPTW